MPDTANTGLVQCEDCGHHFQVSPRGEVQLGSCPDCGGKRMFRMQPNPVQSEGTLRNMVDMETGKDAGGNPDGEGILASPSGRAILAEFMNAPIDMMQGQCRHCGGDVIEFPDGRRTCEHCGAPFEADASSGIPDELRGQIAGAPLTEGTIMQTEHTDPLDTGAHGRDEYTHGHVLAGLMEDFHEEDQPHREREHEVREMEDSRARLRNREWQEKERLREQGELPCPSCGKRGTHPTPDSQSLYCPSCDKVMWIPEDYQQSHLPGEVEHPDPWMDNEPGTLTIPEGHPALWSKTAAEGEHQGWTNWETWHTKAMLDNDRHLYEHQKKMSEEGWTPEQIRDWTVKHVIGPENKRKLEDAQDWNEIPEAERTDPHYEEVAEKSPQHKDIMESWFGGPDVSDTTPNLIDPELVNWDEIHHNIHSEHDEEQKYQEEDQRLKGEGLTHGMPGHLDETNKMLDAWMKHHGVPDENARHYDNPIHVPIEHLEKGYGQYHYPEDFGEPHAAEIAQQGFWKEPIRDLGWHTLHRIQKGLETPYAETMHQALVGQGYPPEQVQHIMRPQYEQVPGEVPDGPIGGKPGLTWRKIEQEPEKGPDPRLDQPGKDVFPTEWNSHVLAAVIESGHWEDQAGGEQQYRKDDPADNLRCPHCGEQVSGDKQAGSVFCPNCAHEWPIHGDEGYIPQYAMPGQGKNPRPDEWSRFPIPMVPVELEHMNLGPIHQGSFVVTAGVCPECGKSTTVYPNGTVVCNGHTCGKAWDSSGKEIGKTPPATEPPGPVKAFTPYMAGEAEGVVFGETPAMKNDFMRWTPGMIGGGLVINGEPHTWNMRHPTSETQEGPGHNEYVKSLGLNPEMVDWKSGVHIQPDGRLMDEFKRKDLSPFIAADPRLKEVEEKTPSGPTMANHSRTNNMEPYETLWVHEAGDPALPEPGSRRYADFWDTLKSVAVPAAIGAGALLLAPETGGASLAGGAALEGGLVGGGEAAAAGAGAAGAAGAAEGASAAGATGGLMSKAMSGAGGLAKAEGITSLVGQGTGMAGKALGIGGGGSGGGGGAGAAPYSGPLQQFTHVSPLAAFVEGNYETPSSVPDVGVKHDDPEDVDQKEFNDQDKNPENLLNPNLQDSGASGEDEVRNDAGKPSQGQFAPDSPAIQRLDMLMPLIEKYYHSEESGANDPMLKELHEMLESEVPGYLGQADPELAERVIHHHKQPEHVHATVHEAIVPPMQQGNLNMQQQALDPTALNPSMQPQAPSSATPPGGGAQGGHCAKCGGVTQADGSCPQCGAPAQGQTAPLPGGPSQVPNPQTFAHTDLLASLVESANHQGPVTPEQVAAVQQYLIQQGRVDEVPNVPLDPGNPEYAKILAEIQQNPETVPTVTPEEQTQPPPPQPQAPGGMPVPGMAPGEAGGQPMQPMSSFLPELDFAEHTSGADNVAPRCPKCKSGTTGMAGDGEGHARCNACGNVWKIEDAISDDNAQDFSLMSRTALRDERQHGGQGEQANPVGVPAADQAQQTDQGHDEDSSMTWQDTAGAPLKAGQTYQMINPSYSLPDLVRVERVKPDGLDVTLLGTFANDPSQHDPNTLTSSTPISKEDADLQQLSFEPVNQTADDQNNEPPPGSAAPGLAQVPPSGQTTDEQAASEPQMVAQSSVEDDCPRCGRREFTSSMITPEATEHDCYRCGHSWVTEEKEDAVLGVAQREDWSNPNADWLMEDEDAEDFSQRSHDMAHAGAQSRSLSEVAEKDDRLRATRAYLAREGRERQERLSGKHFTPREQRELIDEDGFARNSDMLDLEGTHYRVRDDYESKTNPERVRDADLFLGI